jgi:hypothetical protein
MEQWKTSQPMSIGTLPPMYMAVAPQGPWPFGAFHSIFIFSDITQDRNWASGTFRKIQRILAAGAQKRAMFMAS